MTVILIRVPPPREICGDWAEIAVTATSWPDDGALVTLTVAVRLLFEVFVSAVT